MVPADAERVFEISMRRSDPTTNRAFTTVGRLVQLDGEVYRVVNARVMPWGDFKIKVIPHISHV